MYFRGVLDEVQVYPRALVTSEVRPSASPLGLKVRARGLEC